MTYLFVFRTYPDIDHMAPLVWKLLEGGDEVHAVVSPGYDTTSDYRLKFLGTYPGFHLHEVWPPGGGRLRGLARSTLPWALWLLARTRAKLVSVEWGYGLSDGYEKPFSPRGLVAIARSLARSLVRAPKRDPFQVRGNFVVAARLFGVPSVCLPHGLNTKFGAAISKQQIEMGLDNGGKIDWRDRSRFAAYVVNTEHVRRWHLDNTTIDPDAVETRGSLRWAPEWFELNRELAPDFTWPEGADGKVKVVFMVPKWKNRVRKDAVLELVKRLQAHPDVSLALKAHPRPADGGADPLRSDPEIDWDALHDVTRVDSVSLIRAADVIIDVGSSIGIETVMQGKVLLNPTYLHELTTFFDTVEGCCVVAHDVDEVTGYLERHAAGDPFRPASKGAEELMRVAVYGSRDEPFDVINDYCARLRELALPAAARAT